MKNLSVRGKKASKLIGDVCLDVHDSMLVLDAVIGLARNNDKKWNFRINGKIDEKAFDNAIMAFLNLSKVHKKLVSILDDYGLY
ncbi:MAG: hypothetical protein ABIB11_06160 [Candidatus Omnitrophota bacterium]